MKESLEGVRRFIRMDDLEASGTIAEFERREKWPAPWIFGEKLGDELVRKD